jgi:Protein of unknown function (DUF3632)
MIDAADTLWARCCDEQSFNGRMAIEGNTLNGKNWKGFSKEQYRIWSARFVQAGDMCDNNMIMVLLRQAEGKMRDAEERSSSQVPVS